MRPHLSANVMQTITLCLTMRFLIKHKSWRIFIGISIQDTSIPYLQRECSCETASRVSRARYKCRTRPQRNAIKRLSFILFKPFRRHSFPTPKLLVSCWNNKLLSLQTTQYRTLRSYEYIATSIRAKLVFFIDSIIGMFSSPSKIHIPILHSILTPREVSYLVQPPNPFCSKTCNNLSPLSIDLPLNIR